MDTFLKLPFNFDFSAFLSIALGSIITFVVSRHYYKRSGDDLAKKAEYLHQQTQLILKGLEQADFVELLYENGEIIGFKEWKIKSKGINSEEFGSPNIRIDQ